MPIFRVKKQKITPIQEKKFNLEQDIQRLVEANLETVFGLKFIATEFHIEGRFIDTVAYDPEANAFVVIEYKKDRSFSIVDQGLHYLSLLLNNKANFVLTYNRELKERKDLKDFDWSQVRVVFVARSFTDYQQGAINFRDFPIELWEVAKYEGDLFELRQIETKRRAESINKIVKSRDVAKVTKTVKTYTIDDHFKPDWKESREVFAKLRTRLLDIDPRIQESFVKYYIGYRVERKLFVTVGTYKSKLMLDLNRVKPGHLKDPEKRVKYMKNSYKYFNKHISTFVIRDEDDIDYAVMLAKQVFKKTY